MSNIVPKIERACKMSSRSVGRFVRKSATKKTAAFRFTVSLFLSPAGRPSARARTGRAAPHGSTRSRRRYQSSVARARRRRRRRRSRRQHVTAADSQCTSSSRITRNVFAVAAAAVAHAGSRPFRIVFHTSRFYI